MEKTREEREEVWFEVGEIVVGCEMDEVVCLLGDFNEDVGLVK